MLDSTDSAWLFWRTDDVGTDTGFRVTWRATLDTTPPTVDCPRDQSLEVDTGTTSIPVFYEEPTATDEGAVRIISQSHRPGDVFDSGRFTAVFYRFEDAAGNVAPACLFFVNVLQKDMTPPVVVCPGDFTEYVSPGVTSAEVLYDEPTATDNGGPALVLTQSHAPGDTFPFGSTRVSYTFGDRDGNTAPDCIFYVFVTDSLADIIPPDVNCPMDISRPVSQGISFLPVSFPDATATDNSGTASFVSVDPLSGSSFALGTTDVTFSFIDPSDNIGTCTFTITIYVVDTTSPVVTCPPDIARSVLPGVTSLDVTFPSATATDDSGTASLVSVNPPSGSSFPLGPTDVSFVFEDPSGNDGSCTFRITITTRTITDTTPPEVTCPPDITRSVLPGVTSLAVTFQSATATDDSGTASLVSVNPPSGSSFPLGPTDVSFVFEDPSGNDGSCTFRITITTSTITDTIPPVVTCPPDIARSVLPGVTSLAVTFQSATATDDSGTVSLVSVNPPSGSSFPLGPTDVSFVFEDPSGNQGSCTFRITITTSTILDTTPPVVTCPLNFTRLVPRGVSSLRVVFPDATATDDSGRTTLVSVDPPSGSLFPLGPTEITFRFADRSGNVGNCTLCVTIAALGPTGCGNTSCENGATCVTVGEDFVCECLPGFVGDRCEIDINECSSLPCLNGGTCINGIDQFSCLCRQGYSGINCGIVGFCDLEGDWYNECNDRLSLSPTSTGLILGDYYSSIELITGYNNPYLVVGYISRRCDFSSFGFIVTQNNGKSTGSWSGQCHLCDGQEVLYTTWTHRLRVDTCTDTRKATRVGQDKWTRYKQDQAPREA
eukprot:XP_791737.3 PREDICTED: hyalin [Strongylocentrotus purpuratus]